VTPREAATELLKTMPPPITVSQLEEYGIEASDDNTQQIAREILSLNLYWILAAIDAHIPQKYRASITDMLLESLRTGWWPKAQLGGGTWEDYVQEVNARRAQYGRLVDQEGMSHLAVSAEAASLLEDQGMIGAEDRQKLLVMLIDYAPASQYGQLLDDVG
jgi:hypothetical protein